jgi:hypothetical protein
MTMRSVFLLLSALFTFSAEAKTFQNSYVSFDVPDNWNCLQEGVAWTCSPTNPVEMKEAVIVLAAKVAGPEDNLLNFETFLRQPKKITTKVGTPMPSQVMYAQKRKLAGTDWVQAQHLGSEIQEYYTLYLATVKEQLAILVSFSAERNRYQVYNPIFDKAIKTLKITASQQLLFPKNKQGAAGDVIGINVAPLGNEDILPPPTKKKHPLSVYFFGLIGLLGAVLGFVIVRKRKQVPTSKAHKPRAK